MILVPTQRLELGQDIVQRLPSFGVESFAEQRLGQPQFRADHERVLRGKHRGVLKHIVASGNRFVITQ